MDVEPRRALFAAISPPNKRSGRRYIDYRSISYRAKDAREHASKYWPGGWPDLKRRGWKIGKVDVSEHILALTWPRPSP